MSSKIQSPNVVTQGFSPE